LKAICGAMSPRTGSLHQKFSWSTPVMRKS